MIETLINNYFLKERAFYRLNERVVSNITGDTIFLCQGLQNASDNKHLVSHRLADCQTQNFSQELFLEVKNNLMWAACHRNFDKHFFVTERAFYHLNERFLSNITGEINFSTRFSTVIVTQVLPMRAKTQNFSSK